MSIVQFKTTPIQSLSQTQVIDNVHFHLTPSRPNFPHIVCLNRKRALQETIDFWRAFTICPNRLARPDQSGRRKNSYVSTIQQNQLIASKAKVLCPQL